MSEWYYTKDGKTKIGPISEAQLRELARTGQIQPTDMVRSESTPKWMPANQIDGVFGKGQVPTLSPQPGPLPAAVPVIPVPVATADATSSKGITPLPTPSTNGNLPWWGKLRDETREVGKATWGQTVRLVKYGAALWHSRAVRRKATNAQCALGQRIFENGGGNPQVRSQIAALDEKMRQAEAAKQSTKTLNAEKESLLFQLAATALAQKVAIKPAEAEHRKALEAQTALQQHSLATKTARAAIPPTDKTAWRRMLIGAGTVSCVFLFGFCLMCGGMATFLGIGGKSGGGSTPDFSTVDYSIPKVDFSKGPEGQPLAKRDGGFDSQVKDKAVTEEGFTDGTGTFVRHGVRTLWYDKEPGKLEGTKKFAEETWYNGKKYGKMVSWDQNGQKRLETFYLSGEQNGKRNFWHENGQLGGETFWVKGKSHGSFKEWYKNGQLAREGANKEGLFEGKWASWHENGKEKSEQYFTGGKNHGKVLNWHENGQKSLEATYVEGKEVGWHVEWHPNGKKSREFLAVDGLRQGTFTEWHENDQKANEGQYKDGKEEGNWVQWHPDGSKANEAQFVAGKQIGIQTDWYSSSLGGNIKALSTFAEGVKTKEMVYYPAQVAGPGGRPLGPDHKMHEYYWAFRPDAPQPIPTGTWIDYNQDGSVKNVRQF